MCCGLDQRQKVLPRDSVPGAVCSLLSPLSALLCSHDCLSCCSRLLKAMSSLSWLNMTGNPSSCNVIAPGTFRCHCATGLQPIEGGGCTKQCSTRLEVEGGQISCPETGPYDQCADCRSRSASLYECGADGTWYAIGSASRRCSETGASSSGEGSSGLVMVLSLVLGLLALVFLLAVALYVARERQRRLKSVGMLTGGEVVKGGPCLLGGLGRGGRWCGPQGP